MAFRITSIWVSLGPAIQLAITAFLALGCGLLLLDARASGVVAQVFAALFGLATLGLLFAVARNLGASAARPGRSLKDYEAEFALLREQNRDLSRRIDESHHRSLEVNDRLLRRIGVELHDGPAQLISLALLRLDSVRPERPASGGRAPDDLERIRGALQEALAEIRAISADLALPDLKEVPPLQALQLAARNHERRTATSVACDIEGLPSELPPGIKACLYRFAQEALNNSYRHAAGLGQRIRARCRDGVVEVEVADDGPGFDPDGCHHQQGLAGMRERLESFGGKLDIKSQPGAGTRLTARLNIDACSGIH